jgi:hypothetical protein
LLFARETEDIGERVNEEETGCAKRRNAVIGFKIYSFRNLNTLKSAVENSADRAADL